MLAAEGLGEGVGARGNIGCGDSINLGESKELANFAQCIGRKTKAKVVDLRPLKEQEAAPHTNLVFEAYRL